MHPTPPARASEKGRDARHDKHEQILAAALHLFVERGFHGTAVPEVAKRARVAAGTIYTYFPSKEALVNALYRKYKTMLGQRVFVAFPIDADPQKQFSVMWDEMAKFALENREAFAFLELHHHASYLDAESRELENQLKHFAAAAISRGQASGVFKEMDTHLLMELLFGAFVGMMRAHWEDRVELNDTTLAQAKQACWDAMAAPRATRRA
ncbi:MAG TPA: TetR/AcrR family transcriptional regulator [Minicystis sp.]|nr:TetR/AcrR family transcriptional regulator [Minicystis sp.]